MKPQLQRVGISQSPVVIIDEFSGNAEDIARIADSLAPFPASAGTYYPGVRRMIGKADQQAYSYALSTCEKAAPFIGGAFEVQGFDLHEASFSVVTTPPDQLQAVQRAPHFDSPQQNLFALLHYLRVPNGTGTAFYRHRSTEIERITKENFNRFATIAGQELAARSPDSGYITGSDEFFEQIGSVEAVPDRLIIYHGSLLHSGIIPKEMKLSADPREGRLTANLFVIGSSAA
ncbi:MAG TPA: DUF6445 family protein [Sphingomicrobium sp.]|nr:DUF6445 family protein [Sphingomicrobium sp.]